MLSGELLGCQPDRLTLDKDTGDGEEEEEGAPGVLGSAAGLEMTGEVEVGEPRVGWWW